jgi:hypothetical protein
MLMLDALQILKENGYTFYWNDADKNWWLTRPGKFGKVSRTESVLAENRENAEEAAVNRYAKGRSGF